MTLTINGKQTDIDFELNTTVYAELLRKYGSNATNTAIFNAFNFIQAFPSVKLQEECEALCWERAEGKKLNKALVITLAVLITITATAFLFGALKAVYEHDLTVAVMYFLVVIIQINQLCVFSTNKKDAFVKPTASPDDCKSFPDEVLALTKQFLQYSDT
ncbi:MAG: hypothetical protein LBM12_03280 [Candidatus Nomurabacteria bacterium]|jgi:hypothetical protein|nr:hypothetical protein [Candidatus Nomurabacteria bacterium]